MPYLQTKATQASHQQWLRQAQPLHKQHERGSQRLCVQSYSSDNYLDSPDDDWTDDDIELARQAATGSASTPDRKPMQAVAMPRKTTGAGRKQSAGQLRSVRLQDGTRTFLPKSEVAANTAPPKYTGVGDYDRRMKAAGVLRQCSTLVLHACRSNQQTIA